MNFIVQRAIFFIALMMLWYRLYPNILQSMEETAFWTDAPDMTKEMYHWPGDWAAIASNYMAQFFMDRFFGASIMALLATIVLLSSDVIIWQLFRCRRLQCLSFIPAVAVVLLFLNESMLTGYITVALWSMVTALIVFMCTFRRALRKVQFQSRPLLIITNLTPYLLLIIMGVMVWCNPQLKAREFNLKVEHMADNRNWEALYNATYPIRYELNDNQMAYSLLALSQKGQLGEKLFHYPVRGLDNIFAHSSNFRFNSYFCHELGPPNEAIRYAFEEGQYMPAGASFGTMRRMVDWILDKGDDNELAEFYMNILSHSSCHQNFINTRKIFMGQAHTQKKEPQPEFVGSPSFLYEAALVLEREPDNKRARDYLLCGLLLTGNTEAFFDMFERVFVETNDEKIPEHYLEALLVLKDSHPAIDSEYNIPVATEGSYRDFKQLMQNGEVGKSKALQRYANTYWAYLQRMHDTKQAEIKIDTQNILGPAFGY